MSQPRIPTLALQHGDEQRYIYQVHFVNGHKEYVVCCSVIAALSKFEAYTSETGRPVSVIEVAPVPTSRIF